MIAKDTFPVYAQYNEDIILAALLSNVDKGFYVDVGANHEEYHSVTKYFYDKGWSGINIEPIPRLLKEVAVKRKRDINLQLAISTNPGEMEFREYPEHDGLSTLSSDYKAGSSMKDLPYKDYVIQVDTLKHVFERQGVVRIDFLKVDVEGYEFEVLKSNDWKKYRPTVVAIEANHRSADWSGYLREQAYERVIFDGLNEYYVDLKSRVIFEGFAERAAVMAHNAVRHHHLEQWQHDIDGFKELEKMAQRQDAHIRHTGNELERLQHELTRATQELERIRPHSMLDKSYISRLKIALRDLSVSYIKAKLTK